MLAIVAARAALRHTEFFVARSTINPAFTTAFRADGLTALSFRRILLRLDSFSEIFRAADGPRGPNAARALCKETHYMTDLTAVDATIAPAAKPATRPARPFFSSGPCAKPPGWDAAKLATESLGRSHRAKIGKTRLAYSIDLMRELLNLPDTHRIGIVPGSDTGAFEMAMWTMLGARPVTTLAWESFGEGWVTDAAKHLKLDPTVIRADYGQLPDLSTVDFSNDVLFTWNGTTCCLLYTSPSPRDRTRSRMPSSA